MIAISLTDKVIGITCMLLLLAVFVGYAITIRIGIRNRNKRLKELENMVAK